MAVAPGTSQKDPPKTARPAPKKSTPSKQTKLNLKMREILGDAYGFVRGREYTRQIANTTYEQLLDRAIHAIEGTKGQNEVRATKIERIAKIKTEVANAVATVKKRPPESWAIESDSRVDSKDLVNTEE